jgi:surface carbohydrate biosynthesis protein (TIGR04326 family)
MMLNYVLWLDDSEPDSQNDNTIVWGALRQNNNNNNTISVIDYVENNSKHLRAKYLAFIHDFGKYTLKGKTIIEHLSDKNGYNLWWMSNLVEKSYHNSPYITDCIKLLALEEILLDSECGSLIVYGNNQNNPVYEAIQSLCKNLKISCVYQLVCPKKKSYKELLHSHRPELISVLRYLFRYLKSHWKLFNKKHIGWFGGTNSIMFFSYLFRVDVERCEKGDFYSTQWGRLPAILRDKGLTANWIHHDWMIENIETASSWLDDFNSNSAQQGNHALFENYLSVNLIVRAFFSYCRLYLKSFSLFRIRKAFQPINSAVDLWPLLKKDWRVSLRGGTAIRNCLFIQAVDNFLEKIPRQNVGLYVQENMYWERALLHGWRHHGHGRIIGAPLATVNFWDIRYAEDTRSIQMQGSPLSLPIPDKVALHGPAAKNYYINAGYPMKATADVEALRYLYLDKKQPANFNAGSTYEDSKVKIIVFGELNGDSTKEMLAAVNDAVANNDNVTISLKPHPVCPVNFEKQNLSIVFEPTVEILPHYDLAIIARSTSAAIDVYYSEVNLAVYLGNKELNISPLRGFTDVIFARTVNDLRVIIESLGGRKKSAGRKDFFYLDNDLPRWQTLIMN